MCQTRYEVPLLEWIEPDAPIGRHVVEAVAKQWGIQLYNSVIRRPVFRTIACMFPLAAACLTINACAPRCAADVQSFRNATQSKRVRPKAEEVTVLLNAIQALNRLASKEASEKDHTIAHDERDLLPRIRMIVTPIQRPLYLGMAAAICARLKGEGLIDDIAFDNVFDLSFRLLLSRLANSKDPDSLTELQYLYDSAGLVGGDSFVAHEYLEMKRRSTAGHPKR